MLHKGMSLLPWRVQSAPTHSSRAPSPDVLNETSDAEGITTGGHGVMPLTVSVWCVP